MENQQPVNYCTSFKKNKFPCSLGGNIGTPILSIKKKKNYVIIEASSFPTFSVKIYSS